MRPTVVIYSGAFYLTFKTKALKNFIQKLETLLLNTFLVSLIVCAGTFLAQVYYWERYDDIVSPPVDKWVDIVGRICQLSFFLMAFSVILFSFLNKNPKNP